MSEERPGELPRIPELDEDYQLVRELGRGGTAVVYLARDRELGRDVAIKLIRPGYVRDEDAIARLLREARTIGKLQHPSIVMLLGTRRLGENGLALILQYMPGETLKDKIQAQGPLSFLDTERILRDLGSALQYAHAHRIVHRDIKPENIYLDEALSLARLADFGIARAWDSDSGLTLPGTAIGTPAYMSPEQVDGKELDGRSDIYSLGLVGYEMLTGRQPWAGEGLYNVIYKQRHEELPPITNFRPDTPKNLLTAIEKAIRKAPADRWKDAGELLEALAEGSTLPPLPAPGDESVAELRDWDASLEAVEAGFADPGGVTGAAPSEEAEEAKRRRAMKRVGVAVVAFVAVGLLAIGIGGRAGPLFSWLGGNGGGDPGPGGDPENVVDPVPGNGAVTLSIPENGETGGNPLPPGGPGTGDPALTGSAAAVEIVDGDRQVAPPGATLPLPLVVRVTDDSGEGVSGVPVVFQVMSGGGVSSPEQAVTASDGTAAAEWTLGGASDEGQMLIAWAEGLEDEGAVFLSFVEGGALDTSMPAAAEIIGGAGQTGSAGQALSEQLAVRVLDEEGEPVEGAPVRFSVESGDGSVIPGILTTDSLGVAAARWQLGPIAGSQSVTVDIEGVPDAQLRFVSTAEAPRLSTLPAVATGGTHSCSLGPTGAMRCWGGNADGQLGDGSGGGRLVPGESIEGPAFARVSSGLGHVCGLSMEGAAYCWGANTQGQLGTGSRQSVRTPSPVSGSLTFQSLAAGVGHTCAIDRGGAAYCWGSNASGQLGDGSGQSSPTPVAVEGGERFRALAAGNAHTCGLTVDQRILCWGANGSGQLGDGTNESRFDPQAVATTARFAAVAAGGVHSCGLTVDGGAMCWGTNVYGQLGDGTTQTRSAPGPVAGFERFSQIEAFGSHTCGRTLSGGVLCWGYNVEGQIGDGTRENRLVPTSVGP